MSIIKLQCDFDGQSCLSINLVPSGINVSIEQDGIMSIVCFDDKSIDKLITALQIIQKERIHPGPT